MLHLTSLVDDRTAKKIHDTCMSKGLNSQDCECLANNVRSEDKELRKNAMMVFHFITNTKGNRCSTFKKMRGSKDSVLAISIVNDILDSSKYEALIVPSGNGEGSYSITIPTDENNISLVKSEALRDIKHLETQMAKLGIISSIDGFVSSPNKTELVTNLNLKHRIIL